MPKITIRVAEADLPKLREIERLLAEIGVTFVTGYSCISKKRDWYINRKAKNIQIE